VTYSPNALGFIRFLLGDHICLDAIIRAADVQFCLSSGLYALCASYFDLEDSHHSWQMQLKIQ
jgi:hypothetical protein